MGMVCSCFSYEDSEDFIHSNSSICGHCLCLRCLSQQMIHACTSIFQRGQVRAVPSSAQERASLAPDALVTDNSLSDTYHSPPRPLAYDDPRCSHLHHDALVSRSNKSSIDLHEESEPLATDTSINNIESKNIMEKLSGPKLRGQSKLCCTESSVKRPLEEVLSGVTYFFPSSEDEDVCPTCLEEYTSENPRILLQCSHHFHLSCIYEWMERSEACPVCGKVMLFNETI